MQFKRLKQNCIKLLGQILNITESKPNYQVQDSERLQISISYLSKIEASLDAQRVYPSQY